MAEEGGFEPPSPLRAYTISSRALSTTQPFLHAYYIRIHTMNEL